MFGLFWWITNILNGVYNDESFLEGFLFCGLAEWAQGAACGILVPRPAIEPMPSALEAQSLSYWIAKEVSRSFSINFAQIHQRNHYLWQL